MVQFEFGMMKIVVVQTEVVEMRRVRIVTDCCCVDCTGTNQNGAHLDDPAVAYYAEID